MDNKFIVKDSDINGKGVFAVSPIKNGDTICVMGGKELSIPELKIKYQCGEERLSDPLQISEKSYLDLDEPYIFFNHSCAPNATIIDKHKLVAIRAIEPDEEITYDYSFTEWSDEDFDDYEEWFMECKCGTSYCRKVIGEFPILPKSLKNKLLKEKMVQDFIIRKFKKCRDQ
mgnify:CR=1 FL=1